MPDADQQSEPGEIADNAPTTRPAAEKAATKPARSPLPTPSSADKASDTKRPTGIFARNAALTRDTSAAKASPAKQPVLVSSKQEKEKEKEKEKDKESAKDNKPFVKDEEQRDKKPQSSTQQQPKPQKTSETKPSEAPKTTIAPGPAEKNKENVKAGAPAKLEEPAAKPALKPAEASKDVRKEVAKVQEKQDKEKEKDAAIKALASSTTSTSTPAPAPKAEPAKAIVDQNPPVDIAALMVSVRRGSPASTAPDRTSDSDEEDMNDYFDVEIEKHEAQLKKYRTQAEAIPKEGIARAALMESFLVKDLLEANIGLLNVVGSLPDDTLAAWRKADQDSKKIKEEPVPTSLSTAAPTAVAATPAIKSVSDPAATLPPPKTLALGSDSSADKMDVDGVPPPASTPTAAKPLLSSPTSTTDRAKTPVKTEKKPATDAVTTSTSVIPVPVVPTQVPAGFSTAAAAYALPTSNGAQPQPKPSVDSPPGLDQARGSRPSSPSQPEEDEDATDVDEVDLSYPDVARFFMKTPPPEDLPDYSCPPWYENRAALDEDYTAPGVEDFILNHMRQLDLVQTEQQQNQRNQYRDNYVKYLQFTESDDLVAVKSRDKYMGIHGMAEIPVPATPPAEPARPEGGRGTGRRFATERDLERVLQASMREEDERKERELRAQNERYPSIKEATIPDMYWTDEERMQTLFIDRSGFLPPEKMVTSWQVLPPLINFTPEEATLFEKAYLEFPKQWGRIAEMIPTRDFHACIQYYYTVKKELNLKEKLKRQPKRRKKGTRGKQRSSALVSELGNPDENEDSTANETGENGERRRPRRAAAPTWGFETASASAADSDSATPAGTPGRRRLAADGTEKPDGRRNRRRAPKDKEKDKDKDGKDAKDAKDGRDPKEPKEGLKDIKEGKELKEAKQSKTPQILAPTPPGTATVSGKSGRSRSNSRVQGSPRPPSDPSQQPPSQLQQSLMPPKLQQQHRKDGPPPIVTPIPAPNAPPAPRMSHYYDGPPPAPHNDMHPPPLAATQPATAPLGAPDSKTIGDVGSGRLGYGAMVEKAFTPTTQIGDMLAPPSLRPEQPPPPLQIGITNFDANVANPERFRATQQTSSYWSVSECNDFPSLLRSFGTDWYAIAQHMQSKTPVMVRIYNT